MANKQKWIVTISGDVPISEVQSHLAASGFTVEQVLGEIGCITGAASDAVAAQLRKLSGVADVSPDTNIDIGPPGSSLTW